MNTKDQIEYTRGLLETLEKHPDLKGVRPIEQVLSCHLARLEEDAKQQPDAVAEALAVGSDLAKKGKSVLGKFLAAGAERLK